MTDYLSLSLSVQGLIRGGFAFCMLGMLLLSLPNAHRFFGTARRGGYADDGPWLSKLLSPWGRALVLSSWIAAVCWLWNDQHTVLAAGICLFWCRLFFVALRWKSLSRGMGAPGFMLYWLAALVFFLEWTRFYDPAGWLRPLVILAFKVDFAVIMLCAGQYKLFSGYPQNNGMERGMVNPWWGRLWKFYRRFAPTSVIFRFLNHCAYLGELIFGLMMLYPATAEWGGLLMAASFVFIFVHIRLGFLCATVIFCCFLYCCPGGWVDSLLPVATGSGAGTALAAPFWLTVVNALLAAFMVVYVALLPWVKAGSYYNFYAKKRLPARLQSFCDRWANMWGIIIWRVFTVDNTNFYVRAFFEHKETGQRTLYSRPGIYDLASGLRYIHVCEFVCFVSVFTTLKYFPSHSPLFAQRIWRYARSLPCPPDHLVIFEWVDVKKEPDRFADVISREFRLDLDREEMTVIDLADGSSLTDTLRFSELVQGDVVGSYAPASK
jgi:hypothetical protein